MLAKKDDVFSMSTVGPLGTYVNPGGHVHETLTVYQVMRWWLSCCNGGGGDIVMVVM